MLSQIGLFRCVSGERAVRISGFDDLSKRRDVALEGRCASGGEPRPNAATTVPQGSVDVDVSSFLQRRELL